MTQATNPQASSSEGEGAAALPPLSSSEREALKRSYAEDGYFIVKNVVPREKLALFRTRIVEEFERTKLSGRLIHGGGGISGHLNSFPGEESRFAYEAVCERGIVDVVKEIYPRPFVTPNVGCNLNLPDSVAQHYHVDSSYLDAFMVVNVAVVDTDVVNGAIEVVPGTHKQFYKYWRFALERPQRFSKRLPMNQGDVLVRTSSLWHRGMPNRTALPRPMIALVFGQEQSEVQRRDPFKVNEGKMMFYENWYRPTVLGRMRERTFVMAPFTYSAYRFVRSLFGNKGYATP